MVDTKGVMNKECGHEMINPPAACLESMPMGGLMVDGSIIASNIY